MLAVGGVVSLACGAMYNDGLKEDLEKRAAFDLDCQASSLRFRELSETDGLVTSYGVRGCGQQATYVLNAHSQVWVQNERSDKPKSMSEE